MAASLRAVCGLYSEADVGTWGYCRMESRAEGSALFAHWHGKRSGKHISLLQDVSRASRKTPHDIKPSEGPFLITVGRSGRSVR